MTHDVFISHSSKDKLAAHAACAILEAKGIRCWIAPRDIMPGADWGEAIVDGIGGSRAFVLLFSANANTSQQIKREVERAVHCALPIIPVRLESVHPEKSLAYFLSTPHWLDAMTPPLERHLNYLADVLRHILDGAAVPAPPAKLKPSIPPILQDRRVLIGGGAALAGVAVLSTWFSISSSGPPSFVGKWTAEKISLSAGTFQANSIAFATDIFVNAALQGNAVTGSFEVNDLGQYRYKSVAEDSGSVSASKDKVTFTSDTTREAKEMGYFLINAMMAQAMVNAYGGNEGDQGLVLNPSSPWAQVSLVGKPVNDSGTPLDRIAGTWRFKNQVNGMVQTPQVTLTISADGRYRFRGELDERGLWTAADGKWTRTPQGVFQPITGTYAFDGRDRVTCAAANGSTIWKRD